MSGCIVSLCVSAPQACVRAGPAELWVPWVWCDRWLESPCGCWEPSPRPSSVVATSAPTADPLLCSLLFIFNDGMQESDVSLFFYSWALKSNEREKKKLNHGSVCAAKHRRSRCVELDLWERIRQNESPDAEASLQTSEPDKRHWCATVLRPSNLQIRL